MVLENVGKDDTRKVRKQRESNEVRELSILPVHRAERR